MTPQQRHRLGYHWQVSLKWVTLISKVTGEIGSESTDPWALTDWRKQYFSAKNLVCKMKKQTTGPTQELRAVSISCWCYLFPQRMLGLITSRLNVPGMQTCVFDSPSQSHRAVTQYLTSHIRFGLLSQEFEGPHQNRNPYSILPSNITYRDTCKLLLTRLLFVYHPHSKPPATHIDWVQWSKPMF